MLREPNDAVWPRNRSTRTGDRQGEIAGFHADQDLNSATDLRLQLIQQNFINNLQARNTRVQPQSSFETFRSAAKQGILARGYRVELAFR